MKNADDGALFSNGIKNAGIKAKNIERKTNNLLSMS
jgi:hypothetical protein